MTKQNGRCPLQQECERVCKVVGHERHCDYYVNNRYGTSGIPDQDQILDEEDSRKTREWEEKYFAVLDEDKETDGTEPTGDSKRMKPAAAVCEAEAEQAPVFDYDGLDAQTVNDLHLAEREYSSGRKLAEMGLRRMADGVAIAHDALCITDATICRIGGKFASPDQSFSSWCESMGLNRKAAERLLQVAKLMDESSPREQKVLEELSPSLLYAAAKPSAPAGLVQGVKAGDITTHKQYQELLEKYKAEQQAHQAERESTSVLLLDEQQRRQKADEARIAACRRAESAQAEVNEARRREAEARAAAHKYHVQAEEAQAQRTAVLDKQGEYITRIHALESRPVEVAVQEPDPAEVERMAEEKARAMTAELRGQLKTAEGNIQRMKSIRDSLQSQLEDWQRAASRQATALTAENVLPMAQDLAGNIKSLYNTFLLAAHGLHGEDYRRCAAPLAQALEEALGGLRANTAQYTANRYEEDEDFE